MHSEKARAGSSRISLLIKDCSIQAEVADNPGSRSYGLMQRKSLDPDCGMLFVFPDEVRRSFWMKETYIPLSIAYLNEQGVILNIADMEPHNLVGVKSEGAATYALEMNRGWFGQNGVYPGDQVSGLPGRLVENKIRTYIRALLMEVPLDDFSYVTPTKKDESVIIKGEGDLGFDIVEASTGFGFDREGINLYLMPKKAEVSERLIRKYIRSILGESYLSHTYEPAVGDAVVNTNPKCKHYQSAGVVVNINDLSGDSGKTIVYRTTNDGENWTEGDFLEKTMDQLEASS